MITVQKSALPLDLNKANQLVNPKTQTSSPSKFDLDNYAPKSTKSMGAVAESQNLHQAKIQDNLNGRIKEKFKELEADAQAAIMAQAPQNQAPDPVLLETEASANAQAVLDILESSGLNAQSISRIINQLVKEGLFDANTLANLDPNQLETMARMPQVELQDAEITVKDQIKALLGNSFPLQNINDQALSPGKPALSIEVLQALKDKGYTDLNVLKANNAPIDAEGQEVRPEALRASALPLAAIGRGKSQTPEQNFNNEKGFAMLLTTPTLVNTSQVQAKAEVQASMMQQIIDQMQLSTQNGLQKLTVELKPEHLGKVAIELISGTNGLVAKIQAAEAHTHNLLANQAIELQNALKEKGIQVASVEVSLGQAKMDLNRERPNNGQNQADARKSQFQNLRIIGTPIQIDYSQLGYEQLLQKAVNASIFEPDTSVEFQA